jgi:hypothetical protein
MANVRGFVNTLSGLGFGAADARLEAERLRSQMELQRFDREQQRDKMEQERLQAVDSVIERLVGGGVQALSGIQEQERYKEKMALEQSELDLSRQNIAEDNKRQNAILELQKQEEQRQNAILELQKQEEQRRVIDHNRKQDLEGLQLELSDVLSRLTPSEQAETLATGKLPESAVQRLNTTPPPGISSDVSGAPRRTPTRITSHTVTEYGKKGSKTIDKTPAGVRQQVKDIVGGITGGPEFQKISEPEAPEAKLKEEAAKLAPVLDEAANKAVAKLGPERGSEAVRGSLDNIVGELSKRYPSLSPEQIRGAIVGASRDRKLADEQLKRQREEDTLKQRLGESQIRENDANAKRLAAAASADVQQKQAVKQLSSLDSQIRAYTLKLNDGNDYSNPAERERLRAEISRLKARSDELRSGIGLPPLYGSGTINVGQELNNSNPRSGGDVTMSFPDGTTRKVAPDKVTQAIERGGKVEK